MAKWNVTVPIVGWGITEVEAETEEEAIAEACDKIDFREVESWQAVKAIVTGNIFHGELNRAVAKKEEG